MPRPSKCRRVCAAPRCTRFEPQNAASAQPVELQVDEFEALRLMDYEGLTQEECARRMDVARTTVTGIYMRARRKVVTALVEGRALHIRGGSLFPSARAAVAAVAATAWRGGEPMVFPRGAEKEGFLPANVEMPIVSGLSQGFTGPVAARRCAPRAPRFPDGAGEITQMEEESWRAEPSSATASRSPTARSKTVVRGENNIKDVVSVFDDVQKQTHCSTGCGGCHDKIRTSSPTCSISAEKTRASLRPPPHMRGRSSSAALRSFSGMWL